MPQQSGEAVTSDEDSRFWDSANRSHHRTKVATAVVALIATFGTLSYFAIDTAQSILEREQWGTTLKDRDPIFIGVTTTTIDRCAIENLNLEDDATVEEVIVAAQLCQDNPDAKNLNDLNTVAQTATPQS